MALVRMRQDTGDGWNAAGDDFGMQAGKGERCVKPFFPLELGREWLFVTFAIKALVAAASEKARSFFARRDATLLTGNKKRT